MQHRFFNLDGTPLDGFGGQRPLVELVAGIKLNLNLNRSEYAVFEYDPVSFNMPLDNLLATIDLADSENPIVSSVFSDVVKNEAEQKVRLSLYAEEKSLRHGANMIDPNSDTFETVGDPTSSVDEIRQETGRARAKMHNGKAHGADGGNASVVGSKARNNAAQAVEESIGVELVNIELDIFTGAVTTEAEIDARISAIDLTY